MKRVLSLILALSLVLCAFGCGGKDETNNNDENAPVEEIAGKVALLIGSQESDSETFSKAVEYSKKYGNDVMIIGYDPYAYGQNDTIEKVSVSIADDPEVKAMIFSNGVDGTEDAVKQVREKRTDMFIMVCNPVEGIDAVSKYADVVISLDFTEFGKELVDASKGMGAENFVFYSFERHLKYPAIRQLRTAVETACAEKEMTFKFATSVDAYERSRDIDTAKLYIREDATRKENKFGKETVLFTTDNLVQNVVAEETVKHGFMMVSSFLPSPVAIAEAFGISLLEKPTDSAYVMENLRTAVSEKGMSGRIATWGCSVPVLMLEACFNYALDVVEDKAKDATVESMTELLNTYSYGAEIKVTKAECGAFLISSELEVL